MLSCRCRTGQIDPPHTSTIGVVKYASRRGWSVHAAQGGYHVLELPARMAGDSRAAIWQSIHVATEVLCASVGSPHDAARRAGVQKVPLVTALALLPSAGATVCPAQAVCVSRFVQVQTNGDGVVPLSRRVTHVRSSVSCCSRDVAGEAPRMTTSARKNSQMR